MSDLGGYRALALVDTGATTSGITPRIIEMLGLVGMGKRPIGFAQGDGQADRYLFRVALSSPSSTGEAETSLPFVFEAIMGFGLAGGFRFDALLGMDILSQCDFRMDRHGHAVLSFG